MHQNVRLNRVAAERRRTAHRRLQHGATLLEAVAFLGIAAIVLIGAVALFTSAFSSARSNALTEQVTAIQNAIRTSYGTGAQLQTNLADGIGGLVDAKALPSTLTVDAKKNVTNDWGGNVTVQWDQTNSAVEITYTNVPKTACIAALTSGGNFTGIGTGTTALQAAPLSAANAVAACGSGSGNTINWEFNS